MKTQLTRTNTKRHISILMFDRIDLKANDKDQHTTTYFNLNVWQNGFERIWQCTGQWSDKSYFHEYKIGVKLWNIKYQCRGRQRVAIQWMPGTQEPIRILPHFGSTADWGDMWSTSENQWMYFGGSHFLLYCQCHHNLTILYNDRHQYHWNTSRMMKSTLFLIRTSAFWRISFWTSALSFSCKKIQYNIFYFFTISSLFTLVSIVKASDLRKKFSLRLRDFEHSLLSTSHIRLDTFPQSFTTLYYFIIII